LRTPDTPSSFRDAFIDLRSMIPDWLLIEVEGMDRPTVTIDSCDEAHTFHGTVQFSGKKRYEVSADAGLGFPPAHCECSQSNHEDACVHVVAFVDALIDTFTKRKSAWYQRVESGDFVGDIDPVRGLKNRFMDRFSATLHAPPTALVDPEEESCLPEANANEVANWRLAYFVSKSANQSLNLEIRKQEPKKRGGGFKRGHKVSLDKLAEHAAFSRDPIDAQVIASIETKMVGQYYFDRKLSHVLPITRALATLVGCDRVFFDGEPAEVCQSRHAMVPLETPNGQTIYQFADPMQLLGDSDRELPNPSVAYGSGHIIRLDEKRRRIEVCKLPEDEWTLARELRGLDPIAKPDLEHLHECLLQLQQRGSVILPKSLAGPVQPHPSKMVLVLRSTAGGELDYGIRFRSFDGRLRLPGRGPMVRSTKEGEKSVQLLQDSLAEFKLADRWCHELGLVPDREDGWFGRLSELEDVFELLSRVGELASNTGDKPKDAPEILWDRGSEKPMQVLGELTQGNVRVEIKKQRNWFGLGGTVSIGDSELSLEKLLQQIPSAGEAVRGDFVQLADGQWAKIESKLRKRLQRLRDAANVERKSLKFDATAAHEIREIAANDFEVRSTAAWERCMKRLAEAESLDPQVPKGLDAELRDYQVEGFRWMSRLAHWGVGGILADDMGLGKTLQALAVLLDRQADGPSLVIAPTSVGFNWLRETERFAPDLNPHLYRNTDRVEFLKSVGPGDLVICSYGLALRDAEALAGIEWNLLVLDEAQAIKNSRSKTSKAIAELSAQWSVALTGTPVENHLGELWSLFSVISPGVLGNWQNFRDKYASAIERDEDLEVREALAKRLRPFILRRTKEQVLTELPPRTESNLYVDLSKDERARYEEVRLAAIGAIDEIEGLPNIQDQRFKILALMTRLRQIACHPRLADASYKGSSAKLELLLETVQELKEEGHRALVFSQFVEHLSVIREGFERVGVTFEYLDGSTPAGKRQEAVDRFQEGSADVFLISLKAGGTGLNLTAADYVIHKDPWWNPAVEDQATDRAHRMGQDKPVMVYRIVAKDTIEEEILAMHDDKRDLAEGVIAGTTAAAKLSNDDLIRMIRG
ncbi:MAG: DEAD/DEAH box helicase, partial [Planctomycetota bacterium]